jgi:hypothetical protein
MHLLDGAAARCPDQAESKLLSGIEPVGEEGDPVLGLGRKVSPMGLGHICPAGAARVVAIHEIGIDER